MPPRANQHLGASVEHQRAVWEAREGVVRGGECKLLLAQRELLVNVPALFIEDAAHVDERHVEDHLNDCQPLDEDVSRYLHLARAVVQDLRRRVPPAKATGSHLAQGGPVVCHQRREDVRGLPSDVTSRVRVLPGQPCCDGVSQ